METAMDKCLKGVMIEWPSFTAYWANRLCSFVLEHRGTWEHIPDDLMEAMQWDALLRWDFVEVNVRIRCVILALLTTSFVIVAIVALYVAVKAAVREWLRGETAQEAAHRGRYRLVRLPDGILAVAVVLAPTAPMAVKRNTAGQILLLVWILSSVAFSAWKCRLCGPPPEPDAGPPPDAAPDAPAPGVLLGLCRALELVAQLNAGAVLVLYNMIA
jgi:hypothetical protein